MTGLDYRLPPATPSLRLDGLLAANATRHWRNDSMPLVHVLDRGGHGDLFVSRNVLVGGPAAQGPRYVRQLANKSAQVAVVSGAGQQACLSPPSCLHLAYKALHNNDTLHIYSLLFSALHADSLLYTSS